MVANVEVEKRSCLLSQGGVAGEVPFKDTARLKADARYSLDCMDVDQLESIVDDVVEVSYVMLGSLCT